VIENHPHRAGADLGRKPVRRPACHGSTFSGVGASGKPGAVQTSDDDDGFFAALQELVAYAFEESVRIKKQGDLFPRWKEIPSRSSGGILQEMQSLLQKYRGELISQSRLLDQEDPA
jgi:hypothetical protein